MAIMMKTGSEGPNNGFKSDRDRSIDFFFIRNKNDEKAIRAVRSRQ